MTRKRFISIAAIATAAVIALTGCVQGEGSNLAAEPEPAAKEADADFVDSDDRLPEAIRLVAEFQTCSASFFQRRMRVGYTRGARLVDMLERRGVCAPGEGPRPRNVLITQDDVPRLLDELTSDLLGRAEGDAKG